MEASTTTRQRKRLVGKVHKVSGTMTVVVAVSKKVKHRLYRKYVNRVKKYMVHDRAETCTVGDTVQIEECKPMSARKRWRVIKTLEKTAKAAQ
ncbi:MAG: 30S ribosomal protein S17 [Deltaproteobacteria bacterium]|nr:30S ribosomal protein S17 [Deltaproteobacteria bacterium]